VFLEVRNTVGSGDTGSVGFDPNRKYDAKPFDYALVAICLVIALALLVWAFAA
jgi:hypothetical protein